MHDLRVELHGGTIAASSEGEGKGSRFTVRLKQIPSASMSPCLSPPAERRAGSRRVLLIEDSDDGREMLRTILELAGHVVYDAADGVRGLELVNAERPDVGIIDVNLPGIDGYQIARRIREEYGRGMLLVALTGYGCRGEADRPPDEGFDYHFVKPIDPDQLTRLLSGGVEAAP